MPAPKQNYTGRRITGGCKDVRRKIDSPSFSAFRQKHAGRHTGAEFRRAGPVGPKSKLGLAARGAGPGHGPGAAQGRSSYFPHDDLHDAVYALVVKQLDKDAGADPAVAGLLNDGVAALNEAAGGDWLALAPEPRFAVIENMAGDDFFEKIRGTAVVALYDNDMAWAYFGYEGDAWSKGGYLARGFNDLDWLPDPPLAASPPVFGA